MVPDEGTSVELRVSTSGERELIFRVLEDSRGEGGGSMCWDRRLGTRFLGVLSQGRIFSPADAPGECRAEKSSSEPSKSWNSCETPTSNIALYNSLPFGPTIASRNGMCLIRRGKLLYKEYTAPLLDSRSRWPAAK